MRTPLVYRLQELLYERFCQTERRYHQLICGEWQKKGEPE
jgi:hypothetical protein